MCQSLSDLSKDFLNMYFHYEFTLTKYNFVSREKISTYSLLIIEKRKKSLFRLFYLDQNFTTPFASPVTRMPILLDTAVTPASCALNDLTSLFVIKFNS